MNLSASLGALRGYTRRLMTEGCDIQERNATSDDAGGQTLTWQTVSQDAAILRSDGLVPCRIARAGDTPEERAIAERIEAHVPYTIRLPVGTAVTADNRVEVGDRRFEVVGVIDSTYQAEIKAVVREVAR